jgi:hypothetical protein
MRSKASCFPGFGILFIDTARVLGWGIGQFFTYMWQHKHGRNIDMHQYPELNSNTWSQYAEAVDTLDRVATVIDSSYNQYHVTGSEGKFSCENCKTVTSFFMLHIRKLAAVQLYNWPLCNYLTRVMNGWHPYNIMTSNGESGGFPCEILWDPVALVRKLTMPTERPPLVDKVNANFYG